MANDHSIRVALYSRVSTRDHGQDVENQLAQLRQFAGAQGWDVVHVYSDFDSGAKADRPEFKRMLRDASRRSFDLLLFWSLDRLTREGVVKTLHYLEQLNHYGVAWRSYTEAYLDSTGIFREAVIAILATVAKQERVRLSERTIAGLQRVRAKGVKLGRPRVSVDLARVLALRAQGVSWERVGAELGVSGMSALRTARGANSGGTDQQGGTT